MMTNVPSGGDVKSGVGSGGGCKCVRTGAIRELCALSVQLCCQPKK